MFQANKRHVLTREFFLLVPPLLYFLILVMFLHALFLPLLPSLALPPRVVALCPAVMLLTPQLAELHSVRTVCVSHVSSWMQCVSVPRGL